MEMTTCTYTHEIDPGVNRWRPVHETVIFDDGTRRLLEVRISTATGRGATGNIVDRFFRAEINGQPWAIGAAGEATATVALDALLAMDIAA